MTSSWWLINIESNILKQGQVPSGVVWCFTCIYQPILDIVHVVPSNHTNMAIGTCRPNISPNQKKKRYHGYSYIYTVSAESHNHHHRWCLYIKIYILKCHERTHNLPRYHESTQTPHQHSYSHTIKRSRPCDSPIIDCGLAPHSLRSDLVNIVNRSRPRLTIKLPIEKNRRGTSVVSAHPHLTV